MDCPLCREPGGRVLWQAPELRVLEIDEPGYPGYTRVVLQAHRAEMTDLDAPLRERVMRAVWAVEAAQRAVLAPDKVNLASLGNMVPHLHWHVIPRWRGDRHFPDAVWAVPRVAAGAEPPDWQARQAQVRQLLPRYRNRLVEAMNALLWQ